MSAAVEIVLIAVALAVLLLVGLMAARMVYTIPPNAQGVLVLLGAYRRTLNPGFHLVSPLAHVTRVDLSTQRSVLPASQFLTSTGTQALSATVTYRVKDAARYVFSSKDGRTELADRTRAAIADTLLGQGTPAVDVRDPRFAQLVTDRVAREAMTFGVEVQVISILPA